MVKQIIASSQITMTDLSDAIISGTQPTAPKLDQLWIKRVPPNPDQLFRWNGTAWVEQTLDLSKLDPDADGKIENHDITIGNMVDDAKLDITERQEVKNKLTPIIGAVVADATASLQNIDQLLATGVGEPVAVLKAATNVGIPTSDADYANLRTKYNNLSTYLNGLIPVKPWDASATNKDKVITVIPTDWRSKWLDYYKAVQVLTTAVQTKLQGNIENINVGVRNLLLDTSGTTMKSDTGTNISDTVLKSFQFAPDTFEMIRGKEVSLSLTARTQIFSKGTPSPWAGMELSVTYDDNEQVWLPIRVEDKVATTQGWTRHSAVVTIKDKAIKAGYLNSLIRNVKGMIEIKEWQMEVGNKASNYKPAIEDIDKAIKDADKKAQDVTNSVNDMSLDSKLTPVEKIQLKTDYESITAEFNTTLTSADAFNLTSSSERVSYNAAYDVLKKYIDPLLVKMNETSDVDRTVFRQRFKDYYDTKAKLLKKISDTSKGLIDLTGQGNGNILRNSAWINSEKYWIKSANSATHTLELLDNSFLGQKVYRQTVINETVDKWYAVYSDYFPAVANQTFTFSLFANTTDKTKLDKPAFLIAEWFDKDGTRLLRGSVELAASTNNKWERFSFTTTVPDTAVKGRLRFHLTRNGQIYYAKPMVQQGSFLGEWSPSYLDFSLDEIDKNAEESKNNIADMSNDSKLTPLEKVQLKKEWGTMVAEKPQFEALANSLKITTELNDYINAYTTLNNTLNGTTGYLKNMQSTDDINAATFRTQFETYYAKQAALIKKVNQLIQGNIDGIQGTRNLILNSKVTVTNTNYLINEYKTSEDFIEGQDYTLVVKGSVPSGQLFGIWLYDGNHSPAMIDITKADSKFSEGVYYISFKGSKRNSGDPRVLRLYNWRSENIAGKSATIEWVALYKGTKAFDWSPAPEDADIGKTNLFVDSEFKSSINWIMQDVSRQKVETGIMPNGVRHFQATVSVSPAYVDFTQFIEVEPNTEYTFSMNAGGSFRTYFVENKADKTNTAIYKDNALIQSAAWDMSAPRNTFTRTFKTQPDTKIVRFIFRVQALDAGATGGRFALPKLEKGTTASEWTANPFDSTNGEIFIQGSGADQTDKSRQLTVNGVPVYNESIGRGLRLVTLRKDSLAVVDNILYDVYGNDTERNNLATKINSLGDNVFITLSSYDAIQFNTNLLTAMVAVGASGTILQGRVPYVFIGMKGLGRYNGLEQYTGIGSLFSPATISCKVVNGSIQGVNNNNGQSDTNVRQDLRLNAPLPTSILMDSKGITASGTDASKYARLDYRGLYIAGGAIQIDGGLDEGQLSSGVARKMSYLDSNGLYTGQVNIGGSGQNGILSIKNASNSEIVRGDTNGLTINNGAITIKRPDGAALIQNGQAVYNFAVTTHSPPFRGGNIDTRSWYYHTTKGLPFDRDLQVCDYIATQHTGRYMKMDVDFYTTVGNSGALVIVQAGKYNPNGSEAIVAQIEITNTKPQPAYTISIDCGVPTYQRIGFYFCITSWSAGDVYARLVRPWMEG